jgi:phosphoribosylamine--glycine ligase
MKILVVGSGGREHALAWRLGGSPSVNSVACAPGNPGIAAVATLVPIAADAIDALVDHAAAERYDLTVVGPEAPLVAGLADRLAERKLSVFGCSAAAAEIEGSKAFAKEVMARAGVPTARWESFTDREAASRFAAELAGEQGRVVVKADGLAAGKGVVICRGASEARGAIGQMLAGETVGRAGAPTEGWGGSRWPRVVVEEFLDGREASCMALVDGERVWPLAASEDHKQVGDGDQGPMTGGMGAISPTPVVDEALLARAAREVLEPTARALSEMGRPFRGLLYAGLMVTAEGPKVLEFNCRFGDPETQPLMARWEGDLGSALHAVATGGTPEMAFSRQAACCVVLAARGYPGTPEKGMEIHGLREAGALEGVTVFHAGTRADGGRVLVAGGRVLGVTGVGDDLAAARERAYAGAKAIHFEGIHYRRDIGARRSG